MTSIGTFHNPGSGVWKPRPDWININAVGTNEINLLVMNGTGIAFAVTVASAGTYTIDWGDGTVDTLRASGTTYSHQHTTGGTSCSQGYSTWKVRIYNATHNITKFAVQRHTYTNRVQYSPILWAVFGTTAITTYNYAFYNSGGQKVYCADLQSVTIPSFASCTDTSYMFQYCYSLVNVVLPSSWGGVLTTAYMFYYCYSLYSISLPTSWGSNATATNMFYNCYSLYSISLPTSWGSITDVSYMFIDCQSLFSIILPTSWGSITTTQYMFGGCWALETLTLPSSWGSITNTSYMFYQCYSLNQLTLPGSFGSITNAKSMFQQCYSINTITNLAYLGSTGSTCDFTTFAQDCEFLQQSVSIGSLISKFDMYGASSYVLKVTSIRFTNGSSLFAGTAPQVNISYTALAAAAIQLLFGDLPNGLASKQITITGATGCDTLISKTVGTTVNSTTITVGTTSSLAVGMEVYGTTINDGRAATTQGSPTNTITYNNHGLPANKPIMFTSITTTTGIVINTTYYVVNPTANTFQVSATVGGGALTLTNSGSATYIVVPVIQTINLNTNIIVDVPCDATNASVAMTAGVLQRSIAQLKGWTVNN